MVFRASSTLDLTLAKGHLPSRAAGSVHHRLDGHGLNEHRLFDFVVIGIKLNWSFINCMGNVQSPADFAEDREVLIHARGLAERDVESAGPCFEILFIPCANGALLVRKLGDLGPEPVADAAVTRSAR